MGFAGHRGDFPLVAPHHNGLRTCLNVLDMKSALRVDGPPEARMRRLHAIRHVAFEDLGVVTEVARQLGFTPCYHRAPALARQGAVRSDELDGVCHVPLALRGCSPAASRAPWYVVQHTRA